MSSDIANERTELLGKAYKEAQVIEDKCIGYERCEEVCWHEALRW